MIKDEKYISKVTEEFKVKDVKYARESEGKI